MFDGGPGDAMRGLFAAVLLPGIIEGGPIDILCMVR